jgi:hypothetical protein
MLTEGRTGGHDEAKRPKILHSAHTMHVRVLYGCEHKHRLFPSTALTDLFCITEAERVYCAVRTGSLYTKFLSLKVNRIEEKERKHESVL